MAFVEIIFNVLSGGILFAYWAMVFIIFYHLSRFGIGVQPKKFAAAFLIGSVVLSTLAIIFFMRVDISFLLNQ